MTIKEGRYYLDGMGEVRGPIITITYPSARFMCSKSFRLYDTSGRNATYPLSDYDLTTECDKDGNPITENNMENLDELKRKYKELGEAIEEAIERLETKLLTWADIKNKPGLHFRLEGEYFPRRITCKDGYIAVQPEGSRVSIWHAPSKHIPDR